MSIRSLALPAVFVVLLLNAELDAATAHYRFENSLASEANSPALDATAGSTAGYSTDVPGSAIVDGITSTSLANSASYNHGTGTASSIGDHDTLNSVIAGGGFTVEAFIKLDSSGSSSFDLIIGNLTSVGDKGWSLGMDNAGKLRFAASQANGGTFKTATTPTAITTDVWHHVAAVGTYSEKTGAGLVDYVDVQLYVDYATAGTVTRYFAPASSGEPGVSGPTIVLNPANYAIGAANPFTGLIDEIRVTNSALSTSQMLTAVPEPAALGLMGFGGLLLFRWRDR